ncbi:hypothetical protein F511_43161 [Dorcoceras hygrometricum]|uniref:Uncharacterized protein n=1 Tax=Dorcoceras hygrometricum TaxID=472368 RepID=A0A2Z7C7X4_9LAMI|nr:hypothetical protein F511_43161 [Dorcoceras hygrometricum]
MTKRGKIEAEVLSHLRMIKIDLVEAVVTEAVVDLVVVRVEGTGVDLQNEGAVILVFGNISAVELKHSVDGFLFQRL